MNYLEITRKYWSFFPGEAPAFVRDRIKHLVKSGYLSFGGVSGLRETYLVVGGPAEYDRGGDSLVEAMT